MKKSFLLMIAMIFVGLNEPVSHGQVLPPSSGGNSGGGVKALNWWSTRVVLQKASRTLTADRGTYDWEGVSESDLGGIKVLQWEDEDHKASGYDDNTSRGELQYLATASGSRAFSRVEVEVDDQWDYGDTSLTLTTTTEFENSAELYWDGDELHPCPEMTAQLTAGVNVKLHIDGVVAADSSNPAVSSATAKITASWVAGDPFNYNFNFDEIGISGRAGNSPNINSFVNWIGFVKFPPAWGVVVDFDQNIDDDPADNTFSKDIIYSAAQNPIKQRISGGVGYSWKGIAFAKGTAYSNGATAKANATADIGTSMNIGILPEESAQEVE